MIKKVVMMKYNILTYLIGEGFANVFKNKKQAATSFGTMCVIMIFFGICFIVVGNFNHFIKQVESQQGIQAYIVNDATDEETKEIGQKIQELDGVNTIEFISKEQALGQMKEKLGEKSYLLDGYEQNNVFPASYIITVTDLTKIDNVINEVKQMEQIKKVTSSNETISTLVKIAKGVKLGSYVIITVLVAVSVFIISNIIKLTVYARRKEISIMKYVGATNGFIRWPFAVEGIIIGLISGAISLGIIATLYLLIAQNVNFISFLSKIGLSLLEFSEMFNLILIVYLVLGVGIGILGSTLSMRKYLKV
jgi:cell division transport system permease protein